MKRFIASAVLLCAVMIAMLMPACETAVSDPNEEESTVWLNMNTEYPTPDGLADGGGARVRVVVLIGQSNATGSSICEYLRENIGEEEYARLGAGFDNVLINYCLDDHNATSGGQFKRVDLTCGATDGFFGPEVGMADVLSTAYPDETVIILKYTMSGYSLHHHWLCDGERGSIYLAFIEFLDTYMGVLRANNYDAEIGAVCWMQGESDTSEYKAAHYYDNQRSFVSYIREDLEKYAEDGVLYFIDAGISNGPYCEPGYPEVNEAKRRLSEEFHLNLYFSTIDLGFTVMLEPPGEPDPGHYDSVSELMLGRKFGELVIRSYEMRENGGSE